MAPVPAVPLHAMRLGHLAPATPISADVFLQPRNPGALAALVSAVSTPGSPLRGDYLTPRQLWSRFGPSKAEVRDVSAGLRARGLRIGPVTPDRLTIRVSGTAGSVGHALGTSFAAYRLAGGSVVYANTSPARLPSAVANHVLTVIGLSDVARYQPLDVTSQNTAAAPHKSSSPAARSQQSVPSGAPRPCAKATSQRSSGAYTADQLAAAYGMTGLYSKGDFGKGVTVGIFELERNYASDIKAYEKCYGISTPVTNVNIDGGATGAAYGSGEAALDIEDVAGLAPGIKIDVYRAPNDNVGPMDEFHYIVDHPSAKVITTSWGQCEQTIASSRSAALKAARAESVLFEFAAAEGQSWMSASGDSGSTDCAPYAGDALAVDDPGVQPYVTSVGGTKLHVAAGGNKESVWNDSSGSGGGGISELWRMPAYQSGAPKSLNVVNKHSSISTCHAMSGYCREVPDVTANADLSTGYITYWLGSWGPVGGTSAAAPLWAAVIALTDASTACGGRSVGFLNPVLYAIAGSKSYAGAFTDITTGNNDATKFGYTGGLYPATAGYDMASGLGSPRVTSSTGGLAHDLCAAAKTTRPGVDSISPASGPAAGGNQATIYGYGFTNVTSVYFGTKKASFKVEQSTQPAPTKILVTVPPGTGVQWVTVHNGTHTNKHTPGDQYTYVS